MIAYINITKTAPPNCINIYLTKNTLNNERDRNYDTKYIK